MSADWIVVAVNGTAGDRKPWKLGIFAAAAQQEVCLQLACEDEGDLPSGSGGDVSHGFEQGGQSGVCEQGQQTTVTELSLTVIVGGFCQSRCRLDHFVPRE
jgi:hypothetical protein